MIDFHPSFLVDFPWVMTSYFILDGMQKKPKAHLRMQSLNLRRGAIAAHIHSYSASSLRTTLKHWSGPLVARGACAVLGNVYEPLLQMTTYLDIFNARLLAGFTFAESAWIATPVLSWMQVMIGDPLYQPFKSSVEIPKEGDYAYKAFKKTILSSFADEEKLKTQLDLVSQDIENGSIF